MNPHKALNYSGRRLSAGCGRAEKRDFLPAHCLWKISGFSAGSLGRIFLHVRMLMKISGFSAGSLGRIFLHVRML